MVSSENYKKEEEIFVELYYKLFETSETYKLTDLESLTSEKFLISLLREIDPEIEDIGGKIQISPDRSFGMRYANFVSIMNTIEKYLENSPEKGRFVEYSSDIKYKIKINDFLKNDRDQLFLMAELLIFLTAISSKVDMFLDKLEQVEDKYIHLYCSISDKYLININETQQNKTYIEEYRTNRTEKLQKINIESKENNKLLKTISDLERENNSLKEQNNFIEKKFNDLEIKYKDALRDVEFLKNSNKKNMQVQEELLKDSMLTSQLKSQLSQKEMELVDLKSEYEFQIKSQDEKIASLNEKLELYNDKISTLQSLANENEKLKLKIKELNLLKEKQVEYEDLMISIESKNRMIDSSIKDKQNLFAQLEKLNGEFLAEKDKTRRLENDRKRLEADLIETKNEFSRIEKQLKISEAQVTNFQNIKRNSSTDTEFGTVSLGDIDRNIFMKEVEKTKDERIKLLEFQNEELKKEKLDLIKQIQSDEFNSKFNEVALLNSQIDQLNLENKKIINERDKLLIEREKLLIKIQKVELNVQRAEINDTERKVLEDELRDLKEKLKKAESQNNEYEREISELKIQIKKLQFSLTKTQNENNYSEKVNSEIKNMKQRDEFIESLEEKLNYIESKNYQNVIEKLNEELKKYSNGLDYYKRIYEEEKARAKREHELITSSFYELAMQFVILKNETHKKSNQEVSKNWLETERNKNFPLGNK